MSPSGDSPVDVVSSSRPFTAGWKLGSSDTLFGQFQLACRYCVFDPIRAPLLPIGFRLEVRDLYTSKPAFNIGTGRAFQHNIMFSSGVVLHF
jgi:hypothetical protein